MRPNWSFWDISEDFLVQFGGHYDIYEFEALGQVGDSPMQWGGSLIDSDHSHGLRIVSQ